MNDVSKEEKLDPAKPILWIVIPCYNEKDVLPITAPMFLEQIQTMISKEKISAKSRILFVNDGSKDSTWDIICKLAQEDEHYIGISQSRNRGHQNAVLAGLMEAKDVCDITISIDCDGQDDYLQYSLLRFALKMNISNVCSNIQSIFIRDICRYFFQTRGIKELEVFAPQCEVLNKTKILMLDEVFDEYIRKYLEGKQDEK